MFKFKDKQNFLELDKNKRCYYLARLYINRDQKPSKQVYTSRLFTCLNYLKKQPEPTLSILYNYLSDNTHNGLMIWDILPKAILYDQQNRRKMTRVKQEDFSETMLNSILGGNI